MFLVTSKFKDLNVNDYLINYILEKEKTILREWGKKDTNLKAYEWCGENDIRCAQILDPFRWEDDTKISNYIRKNIYRIVKKNFTEIDEMSLVVGWSNILYRDKSNPGWHSHYYGNDHNKIVISGNYYVDSNGTFTEFELSDGRVIKVDSDNGKCILFDGENLHRVSGWDTFEKTENENPRITFSFDILPKELVELYFKNNDYWMMVGTHNIADLVGRDMYDYVYGDKSTGNMESDLKNLNGNRPLLFGELQNG